MFQRPCGLAIWRDRLVVSERDAKRVQVLTLEGVPLQVLPDGESLTGRWADEERWWGADAGALRVHVLRHVARGEGSQPHA